MSLFLYSAIKVTVVVAGALAATRLLRGRSAALRHWVLSAAIVCGAGMPFLELVVPSWPLAFGMPSPLRERQSARAASDLPVLTGRGARDLPDEGRSTATERPIPGSLIVWIWAAGAAGFLSLLVIGFARLTWVASAARCVEGGPWARAADEISRETGLRRPVTLLFCAQPALLVTWGLWRPKILLPAAATEWSDDRIRIVLRHELAHVRRGDWLVQLAAEIVRAVYWFNPLLWIAARRLRRESEQAADDAVLTHGVNASVYATHLLELARSLTAERRSWCAAPAMARPSSLERRISVMLNTRINRNPLSGSSRFAIAAGVLALATAVAGAARHQDASATFSGLVTDPSGAPLGETTVSLTHRENSTSHAVPTDQSGYFQLASLPAGDYALEARAVGFASLRDTITLAAGQRVQRDIRLNLGTVQESITVAVSVPERPPASQAKTVDMSALTERFRGKRLQPPMKLKDVRPIYPQTLRDAGTGGRVVFEARIATDGSVVGLRVVGDAHPELASSARDAISGWQFEPTRLWGSPVEVAMTVTVDFKNQP